MSVSATEYCLCGEKIQVTAATRRGIKAALDEWRKVAHQGDGHGKATRQQAYMARERQKRQVLRDVAEAAAQPVSRLDV